MNSSEELDPSDLESLSILSNYRDWILADFLSRLGSKCVEYGAGIGSISTKLASNVDELHLVEPMASLFEKLTQRFADQADVHTWHMTVEESVAASDAETFDFAVMVNVLEHIKDDRRILGELQRVLRAGGTLCLFVPANETLFSDYDRMVGHYRRYELSDLKQRVVAAGFTIRVARYFDVLGMLPWFILMRVLRRTRISPKAAGIYDAIAVPFGRRLESLVTPPFGKNILLVAQKPLHGDA